MKAQAYCQNLSAINMALTDKEFKQVLFPVMCKDYIPDIFWSAATGKEDTIYGLEVKKDMVNPEDEVFGMTLDFSTAELAKQGENILPLLNQFEEVLKFKRSEMFIGDKPETRVIRFSRGWTKQAIRMSLFCHLCRIGSAYDGKVSVKDFINGVADDKIPVLTAKDGGNGGNGYTFTARDRILAIFEHGRFPKQEWSAFTTIRQAHNHSGIVNYPWDTKTFESLYKASPTGW
jgi:hypothetical protein